MITILIAILQFLGVMASPDLLNDPNFTRDNQVQISRATIIYDNQQYHEENGVVVVDVINP